MRRDSSSEARRLTSRVLDDAIRHGERVDGRISNASVGLDCGVDAKRIREWRDENDPRNAPLHLALQLSDEVWRCVRDGIETARALSRNSMKPLPAEQQAGITTATLGTTVAVLARLLGGAGAGGGSAGVELDAVRPHIAAARRDLDRLEASLAARDRGER